MTVCQKHRFDNPDSFPDISGVPQEQKSKILAFWVSRKRAEYYFESTVWENLKGGLTKGGLSPKFAEKLGGKSFLRNRAFSGQIGTFSGPIGAFSGPIGTNSSAPHSHGGRAGNCPERALFGPIGAFRAKPPFAKPPFGFPRTVSERRTH